MSDINLEIGWVEALGAAADNPQIPRAVGETLFVLCCPACGEFADPQGLDEVAKKPVLGAGCAKCGKARALERYTVSSLEHGIKAQFEFWVRQAAQLCIAETMATGDIEEADRMRGEYMSSRREYTWDGKYVRAARMSWLGITYLAYLLLKRCHPKISEERAVAIVQANPKGWGAVWVWALGNSASPAGAAPDAPAAAGAKPE